MTVIDAKDEDYLALDAALGSSLERIVARARKATIVDVCLALSAA